MVCMIRPPGQGSFALQCRCFGLYKAAECIRSAVKQPVMVSNQQRLICSLLLGTQPPDGKEAQAYAKAAASNLTDQEFLGPEGLSNLLRAGIGGAATCRMPDFSAARASVVTTIALSSQISLKFSY